MRILVIGGNGFIGSPLVSELLGSGHEVAVFHRCSGVGLADSGVVQIQGDRNRLSDYEGQLRRFSPDVIVDLILSSGEQARQLVETAHEIERRVIAISSMDVYRAWGVMHEVEAGSLDPLPLTEDSTLRTTRRLYPPETVKILQNIFTWLDSTTTRSRSKRPYGAILRCRGPSYGCRWCTAQAIPSIDSSRC
jgi:nucleoside-diphosphate-sugar epimerase